MSIVQDESVRAPHRSAGRRRLPQLALFALVAVVAIIATVVLFRGSQGNTPNSGSAASAEVPKTVPALLSAGVKSIDAGRLDWAQIYLVDALKLDPNNAVVLYNLGVVANRIGDDKAAVSAYTRALASDPTMIDARYNLGVSQALLGDAKSAMATYAAVLAQQPSYVGAQWNLGLLLYETGRKAEGRALLRKVIGGDETYKNRLPDGVTVD